MDCTFLELPLEIRNQVYQFLLADSSIVISSLFVRMRFLQKFMCKHNCGLEPGILYACHQINNEASRILYGSPLFQCATATLGLERLRSQVGTRNFSYIRRIVCDPSDLADISEALQVQQGMSLYQRYQRLESVSTDGYRILVLDGVPPANISERSDLAEALRLCKQVLAILNVHPVLSVLAQTLHGISNGGADAVDTSNPRAKWRLLKSESKMTPDESPVNLEAIIAFLQNNSQGCERSNKLLTPSHLQHRS
jgi:hypothetical protein